MHELVQSRAGWRLTLAVLAILAPATATAQPAASITVSDPWIRVLTGSLPAAGYFTLSSHLDHPVRLTGAASPACGSLTLHQTVRQHTMSAMSAMDPGNPKGGDPKAGMPGGMTMGSGMSMQPVAAVSLPAHGSLRFAPGGYHLMCEQPDAALRPGRTIPVTLQIDDGSTLQVVFPVRGARG